MPITIDITQNELFKEAFAEGLNKGKESGLQEGSEKTKKQAIIGFLKLGSVSIQDIAQGLDVSEQYVLEIKQS